MSRLMTAARSSIRPIVEGQVYGATAHGIGAALMETCVYDEIGNMLTSTFSDYTPITAVNMPNVKYGHVSTPSPHSYSGAKGMGEGGAAPIHTISAALQDALFAEGIIIADSYNNADSMFRAIAKKEIYQSKDHVNVVKRSDVRKPITCTSRLWRNPSSRANIFGYSFLRSADGFRRRDA